MKQNHPSYEMILIITAMFVAVMLIGYNVFYIPSARPSVIVYRPSEEEYMLTEADLDDDIFLNLNTATSRDLESLPGVGPVLAQRIIDYREANGDFQTIEQLTEVYGIGNSLLEKISPHLYID